MGEFRALDRQIAEAQKNDEFIRTHEGKAVWMDEVNEARRNEQELVERINKAGPAYQNEFEKRTSGKAFERDTNGEITGLDFGKADDIYRFSSDTEGGKVKAPEASSAPAGERLVDEGAKTINEKASQKDTVSKAEELEAA